MAIGWIGRAMIVVGLLAVSTTSAQAVWLEITGGGMVATEETYGCPTAQGMCSIEDRDYALASSTAAFGRIVTNTAGTEVTIVLDVGVAVFDGSGDPIRFEQLRYRATLGDPFVVTTPIFLDALGSPAFRNPARVTGRTNPLPGVAFDVLPTIAITCNYPDGAGQCSIRFGELGFSNVAGQDWQHAFSVTVQVLPDPVPEPGAALLLVLGLAGLVLRARSR